MLWLLGLRIFEATGADIADLGEEHGHRVLRVCGTPAWTHQRVLMYSFECSLAFASLAHVVTRSLLFLSPN